MPNIFLISDTHFNHSNILTFKREDGTPLRPFKTIEEMNEAMINNWNKTVGVNDKCYHMGDVVVSATALHEIMPRLNGEKILIKGNHDNLKQSAYAQHFKDVRAYHIMDKMILSHIPIHPSSLGGWRANLHGHLHANIVRDQIDYTEDLRYFNVCVEQTNYTPISFEDVRQFIKTRGL